MKFDRNNPWLVGTVSTIGGGIVVGVVLYFLFEAKKEEASQSMTSASVANADRLIERNMFAEALKIYDGLLITVSDTSIYAHIKRSEGVCYYNLAFRDDKEVNLNKAIRADEEALRIFTVQRYPLDYALTLNNLGNAYRDFAEVRDKEENLTIAIRAFQ